MAGTDWKINFTKVKTPQFILAVMCNLKQIAQLNVNLKISIQALLKIKEKYCRTSKEVLVSPIFYGMAKMEILTF